MRLARPELCLSADHPKSLWVEELSSQKPRPDSSVLAGFVCYK